MLLQEDRQHFSHSQLVTMLSCPYKYYLSYIEGREWDILPSPVVFGGAVHEALKDYHNALKNGSANDNNSFAATFQKIFTKESENAMFKDDDEFGDLLTKGEALIAEYTDKFQHLRPMEVEMGFRLPLVNTYTGELLDKDVVGKVDLVTDGNEIYELKTGASSLPASAVEENLQLILYGWAFRIIYGREPEKLVLVNLVKTKKPKIQMLDTSVDPDKERKLLHLMFRVNEAIEKKAFYPNPGGKFGCGGCCYSLSCEYSM